MVGVEFSVQSLFLSRGRSDRKRYWAIVGALFVLGVLLRLLANVLGYIPLMIFSIPLGTTGVIIGINNDIKRLHDTGRSGWWLLALFALCVVAGGLATRLEAGSPSGALPLEALLYLISIGFVVALGCLPGDPEENQFGPPPNKG